MNIRVGASGKREPYSTLNVTTRTAERIVRELGKNQALQEMVRIRGEMPDPTFGYLRSLIEQRNVDYVLTNDLVGRDLGNLVYLGELGGMKARRPLLERRVNARVGIIRDTRGDMRRAVTTGRH